ncbi:MAG: hypothetical protein AAF384_00605 [Pseudomonadota bacterium]
MDKLPSVTEDAAAGEIAELYEDIRTVLNAPTVNLIWRHLAAFDGALGWVWKSLRPLYTDGYLGSAASSVRDFERPAKLASFSIDFNTASLDTEAWLRIEDVLKNYQRTNPANLIALCALLAALEGQPASPAPKTTAMANTEAAIGTLPELIPESKMSAALRADARALEALGTGRPLGPVIAGVPRHLAHWPAFLSETVRGFRPYRDEIASCIATVQDHAHQQGRALAGLIEIPSKTSSRPAVVEALETFAAPHLISNYIVKVGLLLSALGPHTRGISAGR